MKDRPIRRVAFVGRTITEFFYEGIRGLLDYAEQSERWQLVGGHTEPMLPFEEIDLAGVDGTIGFFHNRKWADAVKAAGLPAVNLSTLYMDLGLPRVASDDYAVGRMGAEHLLEGGFVHYAFVGPDAAWYSWQRCAGFQSVIEEEAGHVCHVLTFPAAQADLPRTITRWLEQLPKPLGVMAATDLEGRMLIELAEASGLRVPNDVAVLGVDNRRWLAQLAGLPMSSVELNQRQVGYRAAEVLDRLMDGETPASPQWIAPLGVVARYSTDTVATEDPIVIRAMACIRERRHDPVTVADLLDGAGVSRKTLELHLKRATGLTPRMAIMRAKVDQAKRLLIQTDDPISRVADMCGFDCPPRFFRAFKRETGLTPGGYRQRFGFTGAAQGRS